MTLSVMVSLMGMALHAYYKLSREQQAFEQASFLQNIESCIQYLETCFMPFSSPVIRASIYLLLNVVS